MANMVSSTIGKKIEEHYESQGNDLNKEKQEMSNERLSLLHPTATLKYSASGSIYRIEFFQTYKEKNVFAKVKELFNERVTQENGKKYKEVAIIEEKNVFHAGYIYNTSVNNMSVEEKKNFVSRISSMKVKVLDIENKTIQIW